MPRLSRRACLGGAGAFLATAVAGCSGALSATGSERPPFAAWIPSKRIGSYRGRFSYVRPGPLWNHEEGLHDAVVGPDFGGPVGVPSPVVIGPDGSEMDAPPLKTGVDVKSLDWRLVGTGRNLAISHGGGVAERARTALAEHDQWKSETKYRGFGLWSRTDDEWSETTGTVAVGDSTFVYFTPTPPPMESADVRSLIDARRGDDRYVTADEGFASLVEGLHGGHLVVVGPVRPKRDPLTMTGNETVDRALDGVRGTGISLRVDGRTAELRYVVLYASAEAASPDALRTWLESDPEQIETGVLARDGVLFEVSGATVRIGVKLPAKDVRPDHFRFRI